MAIPRSYQSSYSQLRSMILLDEHGFHTVRTGLLVDMVRLHKESPHFLFTPRG